MKNSTILACAGVLAFAGLAVGQQGQVYATGLDHPVDIAFDPGEPARCFVVEQPGTIRVVEGGVVRSEPFFEVDRSDFTDRGWEQGLLGIALDPEFATNRRFYINYTNRRGDTIVSRITARDATHASHESEEVIIEIDQPFDNHNGGCIRFGPDGMLYIGMGDGGSGGDPLNSGQRLDTLLGKLLRIDVQGEAAEGKAYAVPSDNPFVGREGSKPEIWCYGLRNPWRFEFDSKGRIWIGDVGQNKFEWIHLQREGSKGGENYGWNVMEGAERFAGRPEAPPEFASVPPVWVYTQRSNLGNGSVTGGFLYEGSGVTALKDRYVYADFMSGRLWTFKLGPGDRADDVMELTANFRGVFADAEARSQAISSFGRDAAGELYILDHKQGRVIKIVP